jgi:hypothetical protein
VADFAGLADVGVWRPTSAQQKCIEMAGPSG